MDNIVLIGMPGSGKSSVGVVLAKALGYRFLDVDLLIQEREGALLQEILDRRGLDYFLDAERDAICSVDCRHTVVEMCIRDRSRIPSWSAPTARAASVR